MIGQQAGNVHRGGFGALQAVALEALQLAALRPQPVVGFSRIRRLIVLINKSGPALLLKPFSELLSDVRISPNAA
jgi:hypothetical protein